MFKLRTRRLVRWYTGRLSEANKPLLKGVSDGSNLNNSSVKYAAAINKNVDRDGDDSLSGKKKVEFSQIFLLHDMMLFLNSKFATCLLLFFN